jgi:hypothetical protein
MQSVVIDDAMIRMSVLVVVPWGDVTGDIIRWTTCPGKYMPGSEKRSALFTHAHRFD